MIYLIAALCSSALIAIAMRLGEGRIKNDISSLAVNYFICLILSLAYTIAGQADPASSVASASAASGGISDLISLLALGTPEGRSTLLMGLVNGFFYVASLVLYQYNIRKNGVTLPATFMKLGVLVPTMLAIIAFGERPGAMQITGIILAVAAILVLNLAGKPSKSLAGASSADGSTGDLPLRSSASPSAEQQLQNETGNTAIASNGDMPTQGSSSGTVTAPKALILLLLIGGSGDAMSKVYEQLGSSELNPQFLLFTFCSAIILCTLTAVIKGQRLTRSDILFGCLIGVPNFYSARFLLYALSYVPAVVAYPTYSTGTIILVSLAGVLLFREKMTSRQWLAVSMILAALVLLNL